MRAAILALMIGTVGSAHAANKCRRPDGSITYQDAACDVSSSASTVKIWGDTPRDTSGPAPVPRAQPNAKLAGPPEAAPLIGIYRRWIDAEKLALSTPRVALAGPIAAMQALARDAEGVQVASCMADPKTTLGTITSRSATALLSFMGDKNDIVGMVYQLVDRERLVLQFERGVSSARCDGV